MSYRQIAQELEQAIHKIEKEVGIYYGVSEGDGDIYAQGLEDAINYLDNLVLLVSELASNEQYEELKERNIVISDKQKPLFKVQDEW